jgi:hypothetical protein
LRTQESKKDRATERKTPFLEPREDRGGDEVHEHARAAHDEHDEEGNPRLAARRLVPRREPNEERARRWQSLTLDSTRDERS